MTISSKNRRALLLGAATMIVYLIASASASAHESRFGDSWPRFVKGTVASVEGDGFDVTKRKGGTVSVDTTERTLFTESSPATLADAVVGSFVQAKGTRAEDGALAAERIVIKLSPLGHRYSSSGDHWVAGRVISNDGSTIVVETKDGATSVRAADGATITKIEQVTFAALDVGDKVIVFGRWISGELVARRVHILGAGSGWAAAASLPTDKRGHFQGLAGSGDVFVFGSVTRVEGSTFFLMTRAGEVRIVTDGSTTFFKKVYDPDAADGRHFSTTPASLADVDPNSKVKVVGSRLDDGAVLAEKVTIFDWSGDWSTHDWGSWDGKSWDAKSSDGDRVDASSDGGSWGGASSDGGSWGGRSSDGDREGDRWRR